MITLNVTLRTKRLNAKGEAALYFIIYAGGRQIWFATGIYILPKYWDAVSETISRYHPDQLRLSADYFTYRSRAQQFISNLITDRMSFIQENFKNYVFDNGPMVANPCLFKLFTEYCNTEDLSWSRCKHYTELAKDIRAVYPHAKLFDVNYIFAKRLTAYCKSKERPNSENTCTRKMKQLKAVVHFAQKKGLITNDPLKILKLKEIKGVKEYLNPEELEDLQDLYNKNTLPGNLQKCLQYFLFSCYTGLRYSDVAKLKRSDISNNRILILQEKTDKPVTVPLIQKAQQLIVPGEEDKCFNVFCNQLSNRFLKRIAMVAGIPKTLTYHCSRHTFGTLSIYWGIPLEVICEIMGIDSKTAKIYTKIMEEVKDREMLKWGQLAG